MRYKHVEMIGCASHSLDNVSEF